MKIDSLQRDAYEFGRHVKQGGWRLGLLVARNVQKGVGEGRPSKETLSTERVSGKVSASEFARLSGTTPQRVLRYLEAWERAAGDGHVPRASTLLPEKEADLDVEALPAWGHYYDASSSGSRPRAGAEEVGNGLANRPEYRKRVIESMSPEEQAEVVREAVKNPETVKQAMSTPEVRKVFEDEGERRQKEEFTQKRKQYAANAQATPLSQFFWRIMGAFTDWGRDLLVIRKELDGLHPSQVRQVEEAHMNLLSVIEGNLEIIRERPSKEDDAIEGKVTEIRELTA